MPINPAVRIVALLVAAWALSACDSREPYDSGAMRAEAREVDPFDSISMDGSARLEIAIGQRESIRIEGPERMLALAITEVRGDTLHIRTRSNAWMWAKGQPRVVIKIGVPRLQSLRLGGGNEVRIEGFDGGDSRIAVAGAAQVHASGHLNKLTVDMEGAGLADLSALLVNDARVSVDGVAHVVVHARATLDATMNGVGAIFYEGSPRAVTTHMNGLGTISQRPVDDREGDGQQDAPDLPTPMQPQVQPPVDPNGLQPEYERPTRTTTGVI